jgi:hypothetical protein
MELGVCWKKVEVIYFASFGLEFTSLIATPICNVIGESCAEEEVATVPNQIQ